MSKTRIVCLSDVHGRFLPSDRVPPGDVLIIAGDLVAFGHTKEYRRFNAWLTALPHQHKVVVAGNHDMKLYMVPFVDDIQHLLSAATYLQDSETTVAGIRIYGSPWTPTFGTWYFMKDRGEPIREKWNRIPEGIDVLVTHGPPRGYLDWSIYSREAVGCDDLRTAVEQIKPKLHVFGHIHHSYGKARNEHTLFVNASICDEAYAPSRAPVVVEWPIDLNGT